ncbi:SDR family oxidoreductase [Bifidobacterium aquikefiri]|uniref:SDR family oxidoreductase n=1 Tax=Bifidobacterium aquikefiri TaxID=1653207 RepID=UPI0039E96FAD
MTDLNTLEQSDNDTAARVAKDYPPQTQNPPGTVVAMTPEPDHGESSWVGRNRLEGIRALITGGDSGIGRATAIAFAREGAHVAISCLPSEVIDAQHTREIVDVDKRGSCEILEADIRDEHMARRLVDDSARTLGGLDVLVNNAGTQRGRRDNGFADLTTEEMRDVFDTNLFGTFWVTQQALHYLKAGSSIINVTSIQAYEPSGNLTDYAATKAALTNFTANLAQQLGPRGIRVNAVAPGPIWTPLIASTMPSEHIPDFGKNTPLGRPGQPAELAGAMVFLANDAEASYVSGTVLAVTGGRPIF